MASRGRTAVCREGWYYLLAVMAALAWATFQEANLLMLLAGVFLGVAFLHWRLVRATLHGLEVRRRLPAHVFAGAPLTIQVEVANLRKRLGSWAVVVEDRLACEEGPDQPAPPVLQAFFPYVPAGEKIRRTYRGSLPQRGRYRLGPIRVSTRFPIGLFRCTTTIEQSATLTVYPRLGRLAPGWLWRHQEVLLGEGGGRRPGRMVNEPYGVREWQSGDSLRWIHWRTSARRAAPVVHQYEQHRSRDLAVLVDLWQPEQPSEADRENVERAVSFAATVAAEVCRRGRSKLAVGIGGEQWIAGAASQSLKQHVLEQLATARASSQGSLSERLHRALAQVKPNESLIVVSSRPRGFAEAAGSAASPDAAARRPAGSRVHAIHVTDPEFEQYFQRD